MKPLIYTPSCGISIQLAAEEALKLAVNNNREVTFTFNDITVVVNPKVDTPQMVVARWINGMDKTVLDYETSPEGIEAKRRDKAEVVAAQKKLNAQIKRLPSIVTNEPSLIRWIKRVLPLMDRVGVEYDNEGIVDCLFRAGYKANYGVNKTPSWFATRSRLAGYLVGQFMTCKRLGIVGYCDKYLRMKE